MAGGGGSGYVTGTNTTLTAGIGSSPGNDDDIDYVAGVGRAPSSNADGGDGLVVIQFF